MSKKLIIAISALALAILAGAIAVVGVFAAQQQKVANTFTITYTANNVSADVICKAWTKSQTFSSAIRIPRLLDDGSRTDGASFTADMEQETQYLDMPDGILGLTASEPGLVLCFFVNNKNSTGGKNMTVTITDEAIKTNVNVYYLISLDQEMGPIKAYADIAVEANKTIPTATTVMPGQYAYVFIVIEIDDDTLDASYVTTKENSLNLTLNAVA